MNRDDLTPEEAGQRVELAAQAYAQWSTSELWIRYGELLDEAWEHGGDEPAPEPWAQREAVGLALIDRGATAAELDGLALTPQRFRDDHRDRSGTRREQ